MNPNLPLRTIQFPNSARPPTPFTCHFRIPSTILRMMSGTGDRSAFVDKLIHRARTYSSAYDDSCSASCALFRGCCPSSSRPRRVVFGILVTSAASRKLLNRPSLIAWSASVIFSSCSDVLSLILLLLFRAIVGSLIDGWLVVDDYCVSFFFRWSISASGPLP
jgi:hypothetical protein